tara:strand:- start:425 stop:583 length:159 start_codon:yes stop_codon:yes gene_type:complete
MDKEQYNYQFGQTIAEKSYFQRHLKKIAAMVDDVKSDKKLGKMVREYIEEEF